jgi:3-dehydroquinate synthase II
MHAVGRERLVLDLGAVPTEEREHLRERTRRRGYRAWVMPPGADHPVNLGESVFSRAGSRLHPVSDPAAPAMAIHSVSTPDELDALVRTLSPDEPIGVEWAGDRVIPLENLVAHRPGPGATWVFVRGISEVPAALGALERGADRVVVRITTDADVDALELQSEAPAAGPLEWVWAELDRVGPAGVSERVIVDTTALLGADEGLLVGSAAALLFHVPSETIGSRYTRPRPFRVNAGAPHSYVLMADGSTRYLAELQPGDVVLVTRPEGTGRSVRVGRLKVERRPMLHVAARRNGREYSIFLQEAETVRLSTGTGPLATTELRPPAQLLGVSLPAARHLGTVIDETIEER